jgi:hypothetical protein
VRGREKELLHGVDAIVGVGGGRRRGGGGERGGSEAGREWGVGSQEAAEGRRRIASWRPLLRARCLGGSRGIGRRKARASKTKGALGPDKTLGVTASSPRACRCCSLNGPYPGPHQLNELRSGPWRGVVFRVKPPPCLACAANCEGNKCRSPILPINSLLLPLLDIVTNACAVLGITHTNFYLQSQPPPPAERPNNHSAPARRLGSFMQSSRESSVISTWLIS